SLNITGTVNLNAQNAVNVNSGLNAGSPITIAANQDGLNSEGFQNAAPISTSDTSTSAFSLTVNTAGGGTGNASLNASISVGAGGTLAIHTNAGSILQSAGILNAGSGTVSLTSTGAGAIGTAGAALQTSAGTIQANGGSGGVFVTNAGGASFTATATDAGNVGLTTLTGNLTLVGTTSSGSGTITITANGGSIAEVGNGFIQTGGLLMANSATGQDLEGANVVANFQAANSTNGDIRLVNTAAPLTVSGISDPGGTVSIKNTGGVTEPNVSSATIQAGNLELIGIGAGDFHLNNSNSVGTLAANINGALDFRDQNPAGLTVGGVGVTGGISSGGHNVTLTTSNAITLASNMAVGSATVILHTASGGASETNGSTIMAGDLLLTGAGTFLLADSNDIVGLAANITDNSPLTLVNAGDLTVGSIAGIHGITTQQGDVNLTSQNGSITLKANIKTNQDGGSVTLRAAQNLTLPLGVAIEAAGPVSLTIGAANAGGKVTLLGTVVGAAVNIQGGGGNNIFDINPSGQSTSMTLQGGDGNNTFNLTPNASAGFTVHGGNPLAPVNLGNHLNVNVADLEQTQNPQLFLTRPIPASGYAGLWTFADRQSIQFDTIGTITPRADLVTTVATPDGNPIKVVKLANGMVQETLPILITNVSNQDAVNVRLVVGLSGGAKLVSATLGSINGPSLNSASLNLPGGKSVEVFLVYDVPNAPQAGNQTAYATLYVNAVSASHSQKNALLTGHATPPGNLPVINVLQPIPPVDIVNFQSKLSTLTPAQGTYLVSGLFDSTGLDGNGNLLPVSGSILVNGNTLQAMGSQQGSYQVQGNHLATFIIDNHSPQNGQSALLIVTELIFAQDLQGVSGIRPPENFFGQLQAQLANVIPLQTITVATPVFFPATEITLPGDFGGEPVMLPNTVDSTTIPFRSDAQLTLVAPSPDSQATSSQTAVDTDAKRKKRAAQSQTRQRTPEEASKLVLPKVDKKLKTKPGEDTGEDMGTNPPFKIPFRSSEGSKEVVSPAQDKTKAPVKAVTPPSQDQKDKPPQKEDKPAKPTQGTRLPPEESSKVLADALFAGWNPPVQERLEMTAEHLKAFTPEGQEQIPMDWALEAVLLGLVGPHVLEREPEEAVEQGERGRGAGS
ncbi:MAG: hypothetical protein JO112_13045, partial [Planctomycetes bacterium]|nr:hypothetical protein [Planctomycetota bacterium]